MKIGKYNVPASWDKMTENEKVNYLINSYQVSSYAKGIAVAKTLKAPKAQPMPKKNKSVFWWNKD